MRVSSLSGASAQSTGIVRPIQIALWRGQAKCTGTHCRKPKGHSAGKAKATTRCQRAKDGGCRCLEDCKPFLFCHHGVALGLSWTCFSLGKMARLATVQDVLIRASPSSPPSLADTNHSPLTFYPMPVKLMLIPVLILLRNEEFQFSSMSSLHSAQLPSQSTWRTVRRPLLPLSGLW